MISNKWSLALIAAALVAPLSASALGVSVTSVTTSQGTTYLENGDTVTVGLTLENATMEDVFGLGVGVWGYDEGDVGLETDNHLQFVSGRGAAEAFSTIFDPIAGSFGGLENQTTTAVETGRPFPFNIERRVTLFNGVDTNPHNGTGLLDTGVDGNQIPSDVHLEVTFRANALGVNPANPAIVELTFGTGEFGFAAVGDGGASLAFDNATALITVVPEPGTALLMGLGLAGLAGTRRR